MAFFGRLRRRKSSASVERQGDRHSSNIAPSYTYSPHYWMDVSEDDNSTRSDYLTESSAYESSAYESDATPEVSPPNINDSALSEKTRRPQTTTSFSSANTTTSSNANNSNTTNPAECSVEWLKDLLEKHQKLRTLGALLTTSGDIDEDILSTLEYDSRFVPGEEGSFFQLSGKVCGNPLHWACRDQNGSRGEEKIRLILEKARQVMVPISQILTAREKYYTVSNTAKNQWEMDLPTASVPIHILVGNDRSTPQALKLLCNAWPPVVHLCGGIHNQTPLHVVCSFAEGRFRRRVQHDEEQRRCALIKILLETAEQTKVGAKGLVLQTKKVISHNQFDYFSSNNNSETYNDDDFQGQHDHHYHHEEVTALHELTTYSEHPQESLALLLKHWPDALLHCRTDANNLASTTSTSHNIYSDDAVMQLPFHKILQWNEGEDDRIVFVPSFESRVECILAILQFSSLKALAHALLSVSNHDHNMDGALDTNNEDITTTIPTDSTLNVYYKGSGEAGFHLLQQNMEFNKHIAINHDDDAENRSTIGPTETELLCSKLKSAFKETIQRTDEDGRTILHYIMMHNSADSCDSAFDFHQPPKMRENANCRRRRRHHLDPDEEEQNAINQCKKQMMERNNQLRKDLSFWILNSYPEALSARDNEGRSPLCLACCNSAPSSLSLESTAVEWNGGLERLIKVFPTWPIQRDPISGLYPFMVAASHEASMDLNTVFELLRYAPQTIFQN